MKKTTNRRGFYPASVLLSPYNFERATAKAKKSLSLERG
jgi:hypothetical protein